VGFYKNFGRPIVKVFLGAVFTYQITYWLWIKLETDEVKQQKRSKLTLTVERYFRSLTFSVVETLALKAQIRSFSDNNR